MNDSLKRTLALLAIVLTAWGGWYGWQSWKTRQALEAMKNIVRSADLDKLLTSPPKEVKNAVDLAVRGIRLTQGNAGQKTFDLNADWATLNQESGAITVRDPDIRYRLDTTAEEGERIIHATSKIGRVEDGNQKVSMSEEVTATYEENTLTGDLAVFLNNKRTLTFPHSAHLDGPALSGTASLLVWDLNTNILTGTQGVRMRWTPSRPESPDEKSAAAAPQSASQNAQEENPS